MAAGVAEIGTTPAVPYLDLFFNKYSRDSRFSDCQYIQFNSIVSIEGNGTQLIFVLNATDPPVCYDISDVMMKLTIKITKQDGSLPSPESLVFPVNNSALSCFESLELKINDITISQSPQYYNYKCYIQNLISFGETSKENNLYLTGWITDNYQKENGIGNTEPTAENEAMLGRNAWFRENLEQDVTKPYRPEGKRFGYNKHYCKPVL